MQILILIKPSVDEFFKFKNPNKHVCFALRPKSTCKHARAFTKKPVFIYFIFFFSSSQINSLSPYSTVAKKILQRDWKQNKRKKNVRKNLVLSDDLFSGKKKVVDALILLCAKRVCVFVCNERWNSNFISILNLYLLKPDSHSFTN